jgi:hypothetical protein
LKRNGTCFFSDGYGENSAAFQVELGLWNEWNEVSIFRGSGKKLVINPCAWHVKLHCMGLHDHVQGPKTIPNEFRASAKWNWACDFARPLLMH